MIGAYFIRGAKTDFHFSFLILSFFIFLGSIWIQPFSHLKPVDFLNQDADYEFKVVSVPKLKNLKQTAFIFLKQADGNPLNLRAKLNNFNHKKVEYGFAYIAKGKLTRRKWGRTYYYNFWLKKDSFIKKLNINLFQSYLRQVYFNVDSYLKSELSNSSYVFVSAIFLGRREFIDSGLRKIFIDSGTTHLLAISGLHVGLIALVVFFSLKILRIKFRIRLSFSILILLVYVIFIGSPPSALRACIMYTTFGVGFLLKRKVNIFNSLGMAGFVLLLINPLCLFEIGFQFSFISVLGIILGFKIFKIKKSSNIFILYTKISVLTTIFVTIAIAPLSFFYFNKVHILGIISNIILIPFFTLLLVTSFIFLIFPFLSFFLSQSLNFLVYFFLEFVRFFSSLKFTFFYCSMSIGTIIVYYLVLISFFCIIKQFQLKKDN